MGSEWYTLVALQCTYGSAWCLIRSNLCFGRWDSTVGLNRTQTIDIADLFSLGNTSQVCISENFVSPTYFKAQVSFSELRPSGALNLNGPQFSLRLVYLLLISGYLNTIYQSCFDVLNKWNFVNYLLSVCRPSLLLMHCQCSHVYEYLICEWSFWMLQVFNTNLFGCCHQSLLYMLGFNILSLL